MIILKEYAPLGAKALILLECIDRAALLLHSHQKDMSPLIFEMLESGKYILIFFNGHRHSELLH